MSLFDQGNLLFVGHAVDVPQMLPATLGSVLREMCAKRAEVEIAEGVSGIPLSFQDQSSQYTSARAHGSR
jgi:hypothetical protein